LGVVHLKGRGPDQQKGFQLRVDSGEDFFDEPDRSLQLKKGCSAWTFSPTRYKSEVLQNSDFKKFDDMLRFVVDCTQNQVDQIYEILKRSHAEGKFFTDSIKLLRP